METQEDMAKPSLRNLHIDKATQYNSEYLPKNINRGVPFLAKYCGLWHRWADQDTPFKIEKKILFCT